MTGAGGAGGGARRGNRRRPNGAATRDALYDLLPDSKTAWQIEATHYPDTRGFERLQGLVLADTDAVHDLVALMKATEQGAAAETGAIGEARR